MGFNGIARQAYFDEEKQETISGANTFVCWALD